MITKDMLNEFLTEDGQVPTYQEYDIMRRSRLNEERGLPHSTTVDRMNTYRMWGDDSLKPEWVLLVSLCNRFPVGEITDQVKWVADMVSEEVGMPDWRSWSSPVEEPSRPAEFLLEFNRLL